MPHEELPKVLIVDDDKYIRDSIKELLAKWHINADDAEDGESAIRRLKKGAYSLILLDMKMGNRDGLDVLNEMKKLSISTPTILITAYPHDERVKEALKYNVNLRLIKPINPGELKKTISQFVKIPPHAGSSIGEE